MWNNMRILAFGDVFWRIWRKALIQEIDNIRDKYKPDFVIVNPENISSWRWPITKHMEMIHDIGVDVFTSGDHFLDNQKLLTSYLEREDCKLIRPANYYESRHYLIPWKGYIQVEKNWKKLIVINVLSETFTRDHVYNPFLKVEDIITEIHNKNIQYDWIVIDFHREVASEGYWMAHFLEWKVSCIYWTHTHIQTNDETIFDNGTGYISDLWMIGSKNSIIWSDYRSLKKRFLTWIQKWKIEQSLDKNYIINGICFDIWENRECVHIEKIKQTGVIL